METPMEDFVPENELERSLVMAATDPAHRPQFYRDFLNAEILVIEVDPPERAHGASVSLEGNVKLLKHDYDGELMIPIFSSLARLRAVLSAPMHYLELRGADLLSMIKDTSLILNPGAPYGKVLTPSEIAGMLHEGGVSGVEPIEIDAGQRVVIGEPEMFPQEFADALCRYFKRNREVECAYIGLIQLAGDTAPPHTLVAVDATGNLNELFAGIGVIAAGVSIPNPPVDAIPLRDEDWIFEYFQNNATPFYVRKKILGLF